MTRFNSFLYWGTAASCGYEFVALCTNGVARREILPTISILTGRCPPPVKLGVVGIVLSGLAHHLLEEGT